jgi:hypothetical protein
MKVYRRSRGIAPLILNFDTIWEWLLSRPGCFITKKEPRYLVNWRIDTPDTVCLYCETIENMCKLFTTSLVFILSGRTRLLSNKSVISAAYIAFRSRSLIAQSSIRTGTAITLQNVNSSFHLRPPFLVIVLPVYTQNTNSTVFVHTAPKTEL